MTKKWTEDDLEYLEYCLRNQEDLTLQSMAEHLGRTKRAIIQKSYRLRSEDKSLSRLRERFSDKENKYIISCYKSGIPPKIIAQQTGRSVESIHVQCMKLGLTGRRLIKDYDEEVRNLAERGYWKAMIARRLSFDESAIDRYTKKHNIICPPADKKRTQKLIREINEMRFAKYGIARRNE